MPRAYFPEIINFDSLKSYKILAQNVSEVKMLVTLAFKGKFVGETKSSSDCGARQTDVFSLKSSFSGIKTHRTRKSTFCLNSLTRNQYFSIFQMVQEKKDSHPKV
jgi:hypothetical protein